MMLQTPSLIAGSGSRALIMIHWDVEHTIDHREHNLLHLYKAETCNKQFTIQLQKLQQLEIDILINYYEKMAVRIRE